MEVVGVDLLDDRVDDVWFFVFAGEDFDLEEKVEVHLSVFVLISSRLQMRDKFLKSLQTDLIKEEVFEVFGDETRRQRKVLLADLEERVHHCHEN